MFNEHIPAFSVYGNRMLIYFMLMMTLQNIEAPSFFVGLCGGMTMVNSLLWGYWFTNSLFGK
jgi:hypothetical protein